MEDKKTNESSNYELDSAAGKELGNVNYNISQDASCSITISVIPDFYADPDAAAEVHSLVDTILAESKTYLPATTATTTN